MEPKHGDIYDPEFESDYYEGARTLTIDSVVNPYGDGGFCIIASDGVGYDCYWSAKLNMWVYALE